jgi:CRP-like cAMP-binding protein
MYTNSITPHTVSGMDNHFREELESLKMGEPTVRTMAGPAHWDLFKYISASSGMTLSDQHKYLITETVKLKRLRKRQYFLQEGDVCKYLGFIIKGATRMFSVNERGQESIVAFGLENSWVTDQESFKNVDYSCYHIEALEDTEMLIINPSQLEYLANAIPAFAAMYSKFQLQQLIYNQKRINASLSMTAEERYYELLKSKPQYTQRFSQNMIACYLGVKPETLSRIRKNKF